MSRTARQLAMVDKETTRSELIMGESGLQQGQAPSLLPLPVYLCSLPRHSMAVCLNLQPALSVEVKPSQRMT
jgi:hypothetical protein